MYIHFLENPLYRLSLTKMIPMFLEAFLDQVDKRSNKSDRRGFLDFVRLNIIAHRL